VLVSPIQRTPWQEASLHAERWSDSAAVRGEAGIHARLVPADWTGADPSATEIGHCDVHGIVERFGRYVLGTEGWRAEWVIIRELMAPDTKTALALMQRYPEVKVHVREQEAKPYAAASVDDLVAQIMTRHPSAKEDEVRRTLAGAKLALDGHWYLPDPARPGKYLMVAETPHWIEDTP
jgi:hypothetical protein